ncbi:MAG TPA: sodium/glutamate symporter [Blastocatellia bacterium]|nr:sodium/glutamate symporter [Blastocatellia bacterium]
MIKLDLIHTVAFAGVALFIGYGIRRLIPPLARYNIPAPVIGGLLVAVIILVAQRSGTTLFQFDTALQSPLMIAFFTTIGFGASLSLLKVGGPQVIFFFLISTVFAIAQNVLGVLVAIPLGMHPLFGVLAGSVTLTGGPATGLAFAPLFEQAGVPSAASVAVAAAMVGIISGGLIGGPIGTYLIERHKLKEKRAEPVDPVDIEVPTAANIVEEQMPEPLTETPSGEDKESYVLLKNLTAILVAMWAGSWVSQGFAALGVTLPAYIGAMLVASVFRNFDDLTGRNGLSQRVIDDLGSAALSLFIVLALMTLKLWEIAGLALPLLVILLAQVALIAAVCVWVIYKVMGRDYESAVISGGFCGFMLGTTANAMANMETLVEKYGAAPRAFLVVPMVGAFFIDFTNAVIITVFLNIWK